MRASAAPSEGPSSPLLLAIERSGTLGMTAKQIAAATELPEVAVVRELRELAESRSIARVGRGLWVLQRFESLPASPQEFRGPEPFLREFERDYKIAAGERSGEIQFNPNEQLPVHRWWPYVQGFSADFVRETCERYLTRPGQVVLDPFCGSGTVPVVARTLGAQAIGVDMMPVAAWVAGAKLEWEVDPKLLLERAALVASDRRAPQIPPPFLRETRQQFSPKALASLLRLKQDLSELPEDRTTTALRLAFASILIDASRLTRSPCLGYRRGGRRGQEEALSPPERFLAAVRTLAEDLEGLRGTRATWGPPARIECGNSGTVALPPESVDLAITSPPYVNGMDYVTNYKLDLAWLDFARSYEDLRKLRASMVACDNIPKGTAAGHTPSPIVAGDPWVASVAETISRGLRAKGAYRRGDMATIVTKYFDDLVPVMRNVLRALRPGARFVVVNGDSLIAGAYVPGDLIFARLACAVGFEMEAFQVARARRSGQRRGFLLRESITTLRKPATGGPADPGARVARARSRARRSRAQPK